MSAFYYAVFVFCYIVLTAQVMNIFKWAFTVEKERKKRPISLILQSSVAILC